MADGTLDIGQPTVKYSVRDLFGIDSDMEIMGFADASDRVPEIDSTYKFDPTTPHWRFLRATPITVA